jgi:hypothetical protein
MDPICGKPYSASPQCMICLTTLLISKNLINLTKKQAKYSVGKLKKTVRNKSVS